MKVPIDKVKSLRPFHHTVDKVILHPSWTGTGETYPDLALIKLSKQLRLSYSKQGAMRSLQRSKIVPICLPDKKIRQNLENSKVYVGGWGRLRNEDCFTDNFGPNRHDKCRSPFYYNGKLFHGCITNMSSPSAGNKRCQQFKLAKGDEAMPKKGESLMIQFNRGKRSTICYHQGTVVS